MTGRGGSRRRRGAAGRRSRCRSCPARRAARRCAGPAVAAAAPLVGRRGRHAHRAAHQLDLAGGRMRQLDRHAARLHLRIGEDFADVVDRPARHADRFQLGDPVGRACVSPTISASSGTSTSRCCTRSGLVAKRASSASSGRPPASTNFWYWPSLPVATMMWPSGAGEGLVRHDVGVRIAPALGRLAAVEVIAAHVGQHRHLRVEQRHVDVLAFAGAVAVGQRGQHGDGGVHAGHQVGQRHAGLLRAAAGQVVALAGHRHQAAHALDQEVVAGAVRVRPVLAEAGDRAVDQVGLERLQRCRSRGRSASAGRPCSSRAPRRTAAPVRAARPGLRRWRYRPSSSACRGWPPGSRPLRWCRCRRRPCAYGGPQARVSSPLPGRSILITSAPRSARFCAHHGPASTRDRSSTRMWPSALGSDVETEAEDGVME